MEEVLFIWLLFRAEGRRLGGWKPSEKMTFFGIFLKFWDRHFISKHSSLSDQRSAFVGKLGCLGYFFGWKGGHGRDMVPV